MVRMACRSYRALKKSRKKNPRVKIVGKKKREKEADTGFKWMKMLSMEERHLKVPLVLVRGAAPRRKPGHDGVWVVFYRRFFL